jgi:hypothetical protein
LVERSEKMQQLPKFTIIATLITIAIGVVGLFLKGPTTINNIGVGGAGGDASSWFGGQSYGGKGGRGGTSGQGGKGADATAVGPNQMAGAGNGGDALQAEGTACGGRINEEVLKRIPKEMLAAVPNLRDYGKGGDVGNPKDCP